MPEAVWNYTPGGYQVLKKWLSYREAPLLGLPLTAEEAHDFTHRLPFFGGTYDLDFKPCRGFWSNTFAALYIARKHPQVMVRCSYQLRTVEHYPWRNRHRLQREFDSNIPRECEFDKHGALAPPRARNSSNADVCGLSVAGAHHLPHLYRDQMVPEGLTLEPTTMSTLQITIPDFLARLAADAAAMEQTSVDHIISLALSSQLSA